MLDPTSFSGLLAEYGRAIGWSVAAAIGFSFGVGLALKVFDWLSTDINEREEIKKGNMCVGYVRKITFFKCNGSTL